MLDEISGGRFNPDAPRSEFSIQQSMPSVADPVEAPETEFHPENVKAEMHEADFPTDDVGDNAIWISDEEELSSHSSSSNGAGSSDSSCMEEPPLKVKRFKGTCAGGNHETQ